MEPKKPNGKSDMQSEWWVAPVRNRSPYPPPQPPPRPTPERGLHPWKCDVCGTINKEEATQCKCGVTA